MNDYQHLMIHRNRETELAQKHQHRAGMQPQPYKRRLYLTRLLLRLRRMISIRARIEPKVPVCSPQTGPCWGIE